MEEKSLDLSCFDTQINLLFTGLVWRVNQLIEHKRTAEIWWTSFWAHFGLHLVQKRENKIFSQKAILGQF